jgi:hypothetical protein
MVRSVAFRSTSGFNQLSHAGNLVDGEAVHQHGVAALECRNKASFEIGYEGCCIHRSIKHERRDHPATLVDQP